MMKHFPPFRFDAQQRTLWRGSSHVAITPKAAALLACLLSRPGSWVSKAAILSEVWPDAHVQPDNIKVLVRELRRALGDSPRAPSFIAAVNGFGYEFVAPVNEAPRPRATERISGSVRGGFVERRAELIRLMDAWEGARASAGTVILVEGDRGTGKTALCDEFLQRVRAGGPVRVSYGHCFDREVGHEPYYPLLDALHRLDRLHGGFVPALLATHAPSWLARFPQWSNRRPADAGAGAMLAELRALLCAASRDLPLIMAIDDLQWADGETLGALTSLADVSLPSMVLLIGTSCGSEWSAGATARAVFRSAWSRTPVIDLGALTVVQVAACADARFGARAARALAPAIHGATAGNAALVAAVLDGLAARGWRGPGADASRCGPSPEALVALVSEILRAALGRRLDQLDAREERVLEAAAATGVEFSSRVVAYALDATTDEVRAILVPLARRGHVIVRAGQSQSERRADDAFRFCHPLYAELVAARAPNLRQRHVTHRAKSCPDPRRRLA